MVTKFCFVGMLVETPRVVQREQGTGKAAQGMLYESQPKPIQSCGDFSAIPALKSLDLPSASLTAVKQRQGGKDARRWLLFRLRLVLECVSKMRDVQFRVDLPAVQGDFPQAWQG